MARILIPATTALLMCSSWQVCAQGFRCPDPTLQWGSNIVVDANIVTGGEAELQGKVQSTIENLWSSYPHADHIAIGQNILSTTCYLLKESDLRCAKDRSLAEIS